MAKNHNLYCPECGEKLAYNQSKRVYYCINTDCKRYNGPEKIKKIRRDVDAELDSISEPSF